MTMEQGLAFGVLGIALVLFVWGRWRHDVVALLALMMAVLSGLVPPAQAFAGFAHPAVVTVAAILAISRALLNAGIVDAVSRVLKPMRGREQLQLLTQTGVVLALSGFMNNVGALALMLPVALRTAFREGIAPGKLLMPLSFASLLGGLVTLIGTPPNIIIASFRAEQTGASFAMFDFFPVGVAVAVAGWLFVALAGWRLLPAQRLEAPADSVFTIDKYLTETQVPEKAWAIGKTLSEIEGVADGAVTVAGLIRDEHRHLVPSGDERILAGDVLILRGDAGSLPELLGSTGMKLLGDEKFHAEVLKSDEIDIVETVVVPASPLSGHSALSVGLRHVHGLNLLAVARYGSQIERRLNHVIFRSGDVLLLQGPRADMNEKLSALGCLPLAVRSLKIGRPRRLLVVAGIFGSAIAAVALGWLPAHIAFVLATAVLVLGGMLDPDEAYAHIDWPVIVLMGCMIPVGATLQTTGAMGLVADAVLRHSEGFGPVLVLVGLMLVTMVTSDVLNNSATAILMAPLALVLAERMDVNPDTFLMGVAVSASSAFLTPIGHQSNTLVMEPGGYAFGDYWRMGLPLDVLVLSVSTPVLLWAWPL